MASMTIRNLEDSLKKSLRVRAAAHDRSMEEEAREILCSALSEEHTQSSSLSSQIHRRFAKVGGVDLQLPEREPVRQSPDLGQ